MPGTCGRPVVSSTNKTDCHDITEKMLKEELSTITPEFLLIILSRVNNLIYDSWAISSYVIS
jgi:hypothetical protein